MHSIERSFVALVLTAILAFAAGTLVGYTTPRSAPHSSTACCDEYLDHITRCACPGSEPPLPSPPAND